MSKQHTNKWEVGCLLEAIVNPPLEVPTLGYGQIYNVLSSCPTNRRQYEITIGKFPTCTCLDFVGMVANS